MKRVRRRPPRRPRHSFPHTHTVLSHAYTPAHPRLGREQHLPRGGGGASWCWCTPKTHMISQGGVWRTGFAEPCFQETFVGPSRTPGNRSDIFRGVWGSCAPAPARLSPPPPRRQVVRPPLHARTHCAGLLRIIPYPRLRTRPLGGHLQAVHENR